MMACNNCGHATSEAYVALADECPACLATPFVEDDDSAARWSEVAG